MNENNETKTISIVDLVKLMLKRWWAFVLAAVIAVSGSLVYTNVFVAPMYMSVGTMYISSKAADITGVSNLSDVMLAQELVSTYTEILSSNSFMKKVAEESGLPYSYNQLHGRIKFAQRQEAPVMVVSVTSEDPKEAYILAETVLNSAQDEVSRVIPGGMVGVIDHAEEPNAPYSPVPMKSAMLSAVIALALVAIVVFCLDFFDDRVRNRQELAVLGLPVLAEIPYVLNDEEKEKQNKKKKFRLAKKTKKTA